MKTFLLEATQNKNIQAYLERKLETLFEKCDLLQFADDGNDELDPITEELKAIKRLVTFRQNTVFETTTETDLKSFKKDLIQIQERIQCLKIKLLTLGDILKSEEVKLLEQNDLLEKKIYEWEVSSRKGNKSVPCTYNGWPQEDHKIFIKLRVNYKNVEELALKLNKLLPHISVNCIKEHEEWYKKYLSLRKERSSALSIQKENITIVKQDNSPKKKKNKPIDNAIVREQIAQWKREKEVEKLKKITNEQIIKETEKQIQDEKKKVQEKIKNEIIQWRESRTAEESREKAERLLNECIQQKIKSSVANKLIKNYQYRDKLITKKKPPQDQQINTKIIKRKNVVQSDPERILKPTKQWIQRTTKKENGGIECKFIPNLKEIPKLKIPDWRRNK